MHHSPTSRIASFAPRRLRWALGLVAICTGCTDDLGGDADPSLSSTDQAVINGRTVASQDDQPFVLLSNFATGSFCSATMLTNTWALSAAHCFGASSGPGDDWHVTMGSAQQEVTQHVLHPNAFFTVSPACNAGGSCPAGSGCDTTSGKCFDDRYDYALVGIANGLSVHGMASQYQFPLADRSIVPSAGSLVGKTLTCRGYGNPGGGVLREAALDVLSLSSDPIQSTYTVGVNKLNQLNGGGDSGSGCVYAHNGAEQLVGVNVAGSLTENSVRRLEAVRGWIESVVERVSVRSQLSSGRCMDVQGGNTSDGTILHLWDCNATGAQRFRFERLRTGLLRIVNKSSNTCVQVAGTTGAVGSAIQIKACDGSRQQSFDLVYVGTTVGGLKVVKFKNSIADKCLSVSNGVDANGTALTLADCGTGTANHKVQWYSPQGF